MITLNAVLTAKPGCADKLEQALAEIGEYVRHNEPGTIGFYIGRDIEDPLNFNTYERFVDQQAMDAHNQSAYRAEWGAKYGALFDSDITRYICDEFFSK
ncbi:MAG: putative quinol monooxygenase [Alphaproteobacteria bacterium]|jgi:quinol monooxygenase YgiN|nr:putative quinol monooxygenase [Alphaproteobacteria bacterium]MDP6588317.1 putative quinol monooxygenase [Alphaproteobacteria bacterium]MDP6816817.1 putative quinol monooxygenase [Alphaproteobacteria bacterium]